MLRSLTSASVLALSLFIAACQGSAPEPGADHAAPQTSAAQDTAQPAGTPGACDYFEAGEKNLYWGDMHVHTAVSLDAYAFGTLRGPADAFAFAKGSPIDIFGRSVQLERPLDFTAVTDHAEWMDLMYICTDPERSDDLYCQNLTQQKTSAAIGAQVFRDYVVPTITRARPQQTPICEEDPARCQAALDNQWLLSQAAANEANDPCNFTAFIGFEWSATPNFSHTHRNLIFASEHVTEQAIDYIRFPEVSQLWEQLERQCRPEDGCDVVSIPHNTNMGDGVSFDVETETEAQLLKRAKYERLIEIHQDKGNSECLPAYGDSGGDDCNFELYLTSRSQAKPAADFTEEEWNATRSSYVRSLLLRGLAAYQAQPELGNPLQLGIIGSTDTHTAAPGFVDEEAWLGSIAGFGTLDGNMTRLDFNPGGVVGVWAEENTRASVFAALKRRETYGTSGPRIELRVDAFTDGREVSCQTVEQRKFDAIPMGGEFNGGAHAPRFIVRASPDRDPIAEIEVVKGEYRSGDLRETVHSIWRDKGEGRSVCAAWTDPDYDASTPAFWYVRVKQAPTRRWSQIQCEKEGRCNEFPDAERMIQERAWASPIWNLPL